MFLKVTGPLGPYFW